MIRPAFDLRHRSVDAVRATIKEELEQSDKRLAKFNAADLKTVSGIVAQARAGSRSEALRECLAWLSDLDGKATA